MSLNLVLFGAPGAGKGTQAKILEQAHGLCHLSTGDMLRKRIAVGDAFAQEIKEKVKITGDAESDRLMAMMVEERIAQSDCASGFILDGFPRTLGQAEALDAMLIRNGKTLTAVIALSVDPDVLVQRVVGRYSCDDCGASYHDTLRPSRAVDRCDLCSSDKLSRRVYDTAEIMTERLHDYEQITAPLLPYYESKGSLHRIDGMEPADEVAKEINQILQTI